jgi:predicted amidohydrolase YtcJ
VKAVLNGVLTLFILYFKIFHTATNVHEWPFFHARREIFAFSVPIVKLRTISSLPAFSRVISLTFIFSYQISRYTNHLYYWGDVHAEYTVGPYEVKRMEPMRSAVNHGVRFGVHSDDPITEVNPLFSAWCACNRKSGISGKVYGEDQCLTADEAMRCITLNAAWLLHLEDRLGSIETGKWADFTVLAEEVTEANKATMKDIEIIGTVSGGVIQ